VEFRSRLNFAPGQELRVPYDFPVHSHQATKCILLSDRVLNEKTRAEVVVDVPPTQFIVLKQKMSVCGLGIGIALSVGAKLAPKELLIEGPAIVVVGSHTQYQCDKAVWRIAGDQGIASVNEHGELEARSPGTCVLVAQVDGNEKPKTVRVLEERKLPQTWMEVNEAQLTDEPWTSSDTSIVKIHKKQIKAIQCGDAWLTLVRENELLRWLVKVRIKPAEFQVAIELFVGETCRLDVDEESFQWEMDNITVGRLDGRTFRAWRPGFANVTVTNGFGQHSSVRIKVSNRAAESDLTDQEEPS
jgi:hypothetical protein